MTTTTTTTTQENIEWAGWETFDGDNHHFSKVHAFSNEQHDRYSMALCGAVAVGDWICEDDSGMRRCKRCGKAVAKLPDGVAEWD